MERHRSGQQGGGSAMATQRTVQRSQPASCCPQVQALTNNHCLRGLGERCGEAACTARGLDGNRNPSGLGEGAQAGHVRVGICASTARHLEHHQVAYRGELLSGGIVQLRCRGAGSV